MNAQEKIQEIADEVDGEVYPDYSGRGMYGKTCYGIVCDNPVECIEVAAIHGVRGAREDSMGRQSIIYWPRVTDETVFSDEEQDEE